MHDILIPQYIQRYPHRQKVFPIRGSNLVFDVFRKLVETVVEPRLHPRKDSSISHRTLHDFLAPLRDSISYRSALVRNGQEVNMA